MKLSLSLLSLSLMSVSGQTPVSLNHLDGPDIAYDYSLPSPGVDTKCALINVAMDESGSMSNEQTFLQQKALPDIITALYSEDYKYDHVFVCSNGFGYNSWSFSDPHDYRFLGCSRGNTVGGLVNSSIVDKWVHSGGWEEGYYAMTKSMDNVNRYIDGFDLNMDCGQVHKNMILVTDEDRDDNSYFSMNKDEMKASIAEKGYILNVIVDAGIAGDRDNVGIRIQSNDNTIFQADGTGGYTTYERNDEPYTNFVDNESSWGGATNQHYLPLIADTRGAAWNINSLRDNDAVLVDSFTKAFVEIKVEEIAAITPSPTKAPTLEPTTAPTPGPTPEPTPAPTPEPTPAPTPGPTRAPTSGTQLSPLVNPDQVTEASSKGDPHFTTFAGEHFEYHGQCDLVLAKDPNFAEGLGLDIQIRTKLVRFWSYIKRAAIRIGDDILEVEGSGDLSEMNPIYWFNFDYQQQVEAVGGFPLKITKGTGRSHKHVFEIDLSSKYPGQKIVIATMKEFVKVDFVNVSSEAFGNTVGILGDFNSGKTYARDHSTVIDDFIELGNEWQVLPSDNLLFHDVSDPEFPKRCILPEDPRGERRRRLAESTITTEEAEAACAKGLKNPIDIKDCVYDILATQDLDMVGAF